MQTNRNFEGVVVGARIPSPDEQSRASGWQAELCCDIVRQRHGGNVLTYLHRTLAILLLDQIRDQDVPLPDPVANAGELGQDENLCPAHGKTVRVVDGHSKASDFQKCFAVGAAEPLRQDRVRLDLRHLHFFEERLDAVLKDFFDRITGLHVISYGVIREDTCSDTLSADHETLGLQLPDGFAHGEPADAVFACQFRFRWEEGTDGVLPFSDVVRDDAQAPCIWARLYFCSESHPPSDHPLRTQLGDFTCVKADIRKELIGILPKFRCGIGGAGSPGQEIGGATRRNGPTLVNEFWILPFSVTNRFSNAC